MNTSLDIGDFPVLEADDPPAADLAVAVPVATSDVAKVDLLTVALSRFGDWRPEAKRLVEKYKNVVFDVASTKGMAEAHAARLEVRKPRFAAQNVSKASKSELAKVSKAVGAEETAIIEALAETEEHIDSQIRAEVERKARVKAEEEAAEAARKQVHTDNLARLAGYVASATGKTATQLAAAIAFVEGVDTSSYEEFSGEADAIKRRVLDALRRMHNLELDEEEMEQKREAARIEQERVAQLQREADARLAAERAAFEAEKAAWVAAQQAAVAPAPAPAPEPEREREVEQEQAPQPDPTPAHLPVEQHIAAQPQPLPVDLIGVFPKSLRKAMNETEPRPIADLSTAEVRSEFLLFLDAVDLVMPVIARHAAAVDANRFRSALKRLGDVLA